MDEKKAKGTFFGSSSAREEDVIRKLPDSLISHILSYLPTKEAVRTSVLSYRWKSLWLLIPGLDLNSSEFPNYNAFARFIDRCLDFSREEKLCLHKLKLSIRKYENDNQSCLTRWIDFVATARKLKNLDVECIVKRKCLEVIPLSLFICETLVYLRLRQVLFSTSFEEDSLSVSLPRLKTMRLELNVYANERSLESFISSCPALEDLSIVRRADDNVKLLRVHSQTLTSLSIKYYLRVYDKDVNIRLVDDYFDSKQLGVLVDAPRLEYLNLENEISKSTKTITNSGSLTKVHLLGSFHFKNSSDVQVRRFFTSFLGVKDLKLSILSLKYLTDMVPSLQFCNLSCLEADLGFYSLEMLSRLLAICPNLRTLILDVSRFSEDQEMIVSPVPHCLLSSLEFVEIKCKFSGDSHVTELVRYFAENSLVLKKLVLRLRKENSDVLSDLLALPWRSTTCQFVVC